MTWLAWRRHRLAVLLLLGYALLGVLGTVPLSRYVLGSFAEAGLLDCLDGKAVARPCPDPATFDGRRTWDPYHALAENTVAASWLWAVGIVLLTGLLVGAPLFAREYAQGTQRFVLTQSVAPLRWYLTEVAVLAAPAALAGTALTLAHSRLAGELARLTRTPWFEPPGLALPAAALAALALGAVTGLLVRQVVASIAVTLAAGALLGLALFFHRPDQLVVLGLFVLVTVVLVAAGARIVHRCPG